MLQMCTREWLDYKVQKAGADKEKSHTGLQQVSDENSKFKDHLSPELVRSLILILQIKPHLWMCRWSCNKPTEPTCRKGGMFGCTYGFSCSVSCNSGQWHLNCYIAPLWSDRLSCIMYRSYRMEDCLTQNCEGSCSHL